MVVAEPGAVVHIFFLRHGESCSNLVGAGGPEIDYVDPELTRRGHATAAERAAEFYKKILPRLHGFREGGDPVHVCSSPLQRARQTAAYFTDADDELIVLPYIKTTDIGPREQALLERMRYNLVPADPRERPTTVQEFFAWLGTQMRPGHTRLLVVTHKGFLKKLSRWLLGREVLYNNLDGVEVEVRYGGGSAAAAKPRIVGPTVWRYRPSRAVPPAGCDSDGCRIDVCAAASKRQRQTRKNRRHK